MARRLAAYADTFERPGNPYATDVKVAAYRARTPRTLPERYVLGARLLEELLRAGELEAVVEEVHRLEALADTAPVSPPRYRPFLHDMAAIAHLQLALRENCVAPRHTPSCLLPPGPEGRHRDPAPARRAVALYRSLLEEDPEDRIHRWLLNVSAVLAGDHPADVPEAWRVPASAFRAEAEVGRFRDVAPELGVDVVEQAGSVSMEDFDGDGDLDLLVSARGPRDPLRYFENLGDRFRERTEEAGLHGLVGGVNMVHADYDEDGDVDAFVLRGGWLRQGVPNSLLRNDGAGTFQDATEAAGLLSFHPTQTAAWVDFDGDGDLDLYIGNETRDGRSHPAELYRNRGDGTFEDVAAEAGLNVVGFVKAVAWGDYDDDGDPDLYVSRLGDRNLLFRNDGPAPDPARAGDGARDGGGPRGARDADGGDRGGGAHGDRRRWTFTEVSDEAGVGEPERSFPAWWWDFDNDGDQDLFVSGYRATVADLWLEHTGRPHGAEVPRLYRNRGDGTFEDVAAEVGLDRILYAMGANFGDLDGDGWLDLYGGTGDPNPRQVMPNRMFRNRGGARFQDVTASAGTGHLGKGHGIAFGDVDGDGDEDLYAVLGGAYSGDVTPNVLFRNPGHGHRWVTLILEGRRANRSAVGARLRLRVETEDGDTREIHRTVGTGGSFGASSLRQEIGLGRATRILELEIRWPGGGRDLHRDVPPDRVLRIVEGAGAPRVEGRHSPSQ